MIEPGFAIFSFYDEQQKTGKSPEKNDTTWTSYDLWKHLVRHMKIEMNGVRAGVEKCLFYLKPQNSFIIEKDFAEIWQNLTNFWTEAMDKHMQLWLDDYLPKVIPKGLKILTDTPQVWHRPNETFMLLGWVGRSGFGVFTFDKREWTAGRTNREEKHLHSPPPWGGGGAATSIKMEI